MLIVKTWCLPKVSEEKLNALHNLLVVAAANGGQFGVDSEADMVNLFPTDGMAYGLGSEIVIEVIELPYEPQRSLAAFEGLLTRFSDVVRTMFPKAKVHAFAIHTHKSVARTFTPRE